MSVRIAFRPEDAEEWFAGDLEGAGIPFTPQYEYAPGRRLMADFALVAARLLVEVQGGVFNGKAHGSITGILADIDRLNAATLAGWRVLRVTPADVESGYALALVRAVLTDGVAPVRERKHPRRVKKQGDGTDVQLRRGRGR